ncbi:GNAT family N-acetyltransferase [Exiguobacterium marinum]|uniref:GNAT family N-acetyltransferase n=1 Tax=Exiguobacterium marinum TaxID=273528 RepID=UPI00047DDEF3|nr:GNAT family N-acetyltransferase [Exiguobacterium marinum]
MTHIITRIHEEDETFQQFLTTQLRDYNNVHSIHHRDIREANVPLIQLKIEQEGQVIAGLYGSVYWGRFDLDRLWVDADFHGQGIGSQILVEGEALAKSLGATRVKLTTFSFQAKTFYERFGYTVAGVLPDYPPGSDYYMMMKEL